MGIDEYREKVFGLLREMSQDPDVPYPRVLEFIVELAKKNLDSIDAIADCVAPIIKATIGVYER